MSENNELAALVQSNPVPLIRHFAETNGKALKKQILNQEDGKNTFFISMIKMYPDKETQKDILKLCLEYGYNLTTSTLSFTNSSWSYLKKLDKKAPDYIIAWDSANDVFTSILTQTLGKEKILSLESQGYPLLQRAYKNKRYETIKVLEDMGVGNNTELYKENEILKISEESADTLSFYWDRKKSSNLSEESFNSTKKYLKKHMDRITTIDGSDDKYNIENIKTYLEKEMPKWSVDKQEELVAETVVCKSSKIFNYAVKLMKKAVKNYSPEHIPAWIKLSEASNHSFIKKFIDEAIPLDSKFNEISYLDSLAKVLNRMKYSGKNSGRYLRSSENSKMKAIIEKVNEIQDQDFWISANPSDNNHPWFHTACKSTLLIDVFGKEWLSLHPKEMNFYRDNKVYYPLARFNGLMPASEGFKWNEVSVNSNTNILRDFLQKTWLYKDETNKTCIEYYLENNSFAFSLNDKLNDDISYFISYSKDLFNYEIRFKLFNHLMDKQDIESKTFKVLFNSLKDDPDMDWKNYKIKNEEKIKKNNPDLFIEIMKLRLEQLIPIVDKPMIKAKKI